MSARHPLRRKATAVPESYSPGVLAAIAFCPSPPLLVPQLAAGAAAELDPLRAACADAVRRLLDAAPDELVVLGTGPVTSWFPPGTTGGLDAYGVPVRVRLPGPAPTAGDPLRPGGLPLSLAIGARLLEDAGVRLPCPGLAVAPGAAPAEVDGPGRRALLVMGDGSARRSEQAPGYVDARAAGFDADLATALRTGDAAALRDLDPVLGADLLAAGVPAWHTAATAATGRVWDAELLYDAAPYGVGYLVAVWS